MMRRQDQQSKVFYELSALILNILRSPPSPIQFSDDSPVLSASSSSRRSTAGALPQLTPAGFASLLLGISLALMLCGSVTFFIGFLLMPWVIGLVMVFYFVGIVSSLSMLGRTILCYTLSPPSPRKDVPAKYCPWGSSVPIITKVGDRPDARSDKMVIVNIPNGFSLQAWKLP